MFDVVYYIFCISIYEGLVYSIVGVGISIIFITNRYVFLGHGGMISIGSYLLYYFFTNLHMNVFLAIICSLACIAFLYSAVYILVVKPFQKANASNGILLIMGISLMVLAENTIRFIFGSDIKSISQYNLGEIDLVNILHLTQSQCLIVVLMLATQAALILYFRFTKAGIIMRAIGENARLGKMQGINIYKYILFSYLLATIPAILAGYSLSIEGNLDPNMGSSVIIKGFAAAVMGGMNVPGTVLGGIVLAIIENSAVWCLPSGYKDGISFVLLALCLAYFPMGFFSHIFRGHHID